MRDNFVDKVYDTYLQDDFSYGVDNLNPIREIKPSNSMDIDAQIAQIYGALAKRVENVKKTVAEIATEEEEKIYKGNAGAETNNGADNSRQKKIIKQVGGTKNKIIAIPSLEDSDDPLSLEVELMLLQMTLQSIGGGTSGDDPESPEPENKGPSIPDDLPFDCNCDDETNEGSTSKTKNSDNSNGNNLNSNGLGSSGSGDGSNDDGNGNSDKDNSSDSDNGDDNEPTTALASIEDAMNDVLSQASKASANNEATMRQCAMAEIGFLKSILAVLKIIKTIKQMLDPVLGIVMEAVQLVQLAAQCWNNPTCIGTIVQRVMQTIIATLMGVVASLIAQLWALLGLDCMTTQAQSIIDEIREALAAVGSIVSELNPTGIISEVGSIYNAAANAGKEAANAWQTAKKNMTEQIKQIGTESKEAAKTAIKDSLGLSDDDFNDFMSNPASRKRMLSVLKKNAPTQAAQIEGLVEQVLSIQDKVKPILEAGKWAMPGVTKLLSTFNKVKLDSKNS